MTEALQIVQIFVAFGFGSAIFMRLGRLIEKVSQHDKDIEFLKKTRGIKL